MNRKLPFKFCIDGSSESLKVAGTVESATIPSEGSETDQGGGTTQSPTKGNGVKAARILKFLKRSPKKAAAKMSDSGLLDSITSIQARFCLNNQVEHCKKGDNIKIYCLKDRRWKRIQLTCNRMRRYDRMGNWHNYCALTPLPGEKRIGSVNLTGGTRWVIYYPWETLGSSNPFDNENPEVDEHATTPETPLDEYVGDNGDADNDEQLDVDPINQSLDEPEQERNAEDNSQDLNISGLSKSIHQSEREARRQTHPVLDTSVIALFPGSPLKEKMKAQADRAQSLMDKIKQTMELVDSASTQEVLRGCNQGGIRDEVLELEARVADINCDLYQQRGTETTAAEMKELDKALNGDFRLVTRGLKQLEREMSDNWDRLLQPSTPTGGHRASSTGFLEITDVDKSPLNLGDKSPLQKPGQNERRGSNGPHSN